MFFVLLLFLFEGIFFENYLSFYNLVDIVYFAVISEKKESGYILDCYNISVLLNIIDFFYCLEVREVILFVVGKRRFISK